jgi:hypothetical protein
MDSMAPDLLLFAQMMVMMISPIMSLSDPHQSHTYRCCRHSHTLGEAVMQARPRGTAELNILQASKTHQLLLGTVEGSSCHEASYSCAAAMAHGHIQQHSRWYGAMVSLEPRAHTLALGCNVWPHTFWCIVWPHTLGCNVFAM